MAMALAATAAMAQDCDKINQQRIDKWFNMCGTESSNVSTTDGNGNTMTVVFKMKNWKGYKRVKINDWTAMSLTSYGYKNGKVCSTIEVAGSPEYGCLSRDEILHTDSRCIEIYQEHAPYFGIAEGKCE